MPEEGVTRDGGCRDDVTMVTRDGGCRDDVTMVTRDGGCRDDVTMVTRDGGCRDDVTMNIWGEGGLKAGNILSAYTVVVVPCTKRLQTRRLKFTECYGRISTNMTRWPFCHSDF